MSPFLHSPQTGSLPTPYNPLDASYAVSHRTFPHDRWSVARQLHAPHGWCVPHRLLPTPMATHLSCWPDTSLPPMHYVDNNPAQPLAMHTPSDTTLPHIEVLVLPFAAALPWCPQQKSRMAVAGYCLTRIRYARLTVLVLPFFRCRNRAIVLATGTKLHWISYSDKPS